MNYKGVVVLWWQHIYAVASYTISDSTETGWQHLKDLQQANGVLRALFSQLWFVVCKIFGYLIRTRGRHESRGAISIKKEEQSHIAMNVYAATHASTHTHNTTRYSRSS